MVLKTVYIVRHGYRSNWLPLDQQLPPPTGVDSDPALAPHGIEQAEELGAYIIGGLPKRGLPTPQMIFSSPFYRCVQTIEPTAKNLQLPIHLERGLGEWFKPDRSTIPVPIDSTQMHGFFPDVPENMVWQWDTIIPSLTGETEDTIFKRCQAFWQQFIPKFEKIYPDVESIVMVTHAATKIALGMSLMGYQSTRDFLTGKDGGDGSSSRLGGATCSLDGYQLQPNGEWNLVMNSNTDFLTNGAEMDWHFATSQFEAGSKEDIEYRKKLQREQDEVNMRIASARQCSADAKLNSNDDDDVIVDEADDDDEYEDVYVSVVFPHQSDSGPHLQTAATAPAGSSSRNNSVTESKTPTSALQESIEYKSSAMNSMQPNKMRISGISEPSPLFQTKNNVLLGEWSKLVGTELVFNENGKTVAKVDSQILLKHGRLVDETREKASLAEKALARARELEKGQHE